MSFWTSVEQIDPATMEYLLENGDEYSVQKYEDRRKFRCGCVLMREGGAVHLCAEHEGFDLGARRMREILNQTS